MVLNHGENEPHESTVVTMATRIQVLYKKGLQELCVCNISSIAMSLFGGGGPYFLWPLLSGWWEDCNACSLGLACRVSLFGGFSTRLSHACAVVFFSYWVYYSAAFVCLRW